MNRPSPVAPKAVTFGASGTIVSNTALVPLTLRRLPSDERGTDERIDSEEADLNGSG